MSDFTKITIDELEDLAAARGAVGMEARSVRGAAGAEQTGAMVHTLSPGVRQPFGHVHDEAEELYLVLSGSGQVNLGDEVVALAARDVIRIAARTPRCFEAGADGMELFAVGPHKEGDGRLFNDWWGGEVPEA